MSERPEESEQLPEEAPSEQVVDDTPGPAREDAHRSPGGAGREGHGTGHPDHGPDPEDST